MHPSLNFILLKTFFCQTGLKQILALVSFHMQILLGVFLKDRDSPNPTPQNHYASIGF